MLTEVESVDELSKYVNLYMGANYLQDAYHNAVSRKALIDFVARSIGETPEEVAMQQYKKAGLNQYADMTGEDLYRDLSSRFYRNEMGTGVSLRRGHNGAMEASNALKEVGVPGHIYQGEGKNYVIYDDSRIDITKRLYQSIWYSPLSRAIESHKMDAMSADQWKAWLDKPTGGVKKEIGRAHV